jgi:drug/metabolite transporter (DMT)-like permease
VTASAICSIRAFDASKESTQLAPRALGPAQHAHLLACEAVPSSRAVGVMLIALSAVCFAAMPVFARVVYGAGGDPGTLLTLRFSLAAIVLLLLAFARRAAIPSGRSLIGLLLMGGVGYVSQSLSYFTALTMTSAALLGLLLYLYPAAVAVLARFFFRIPLTRARVVSLMLAVFGAGLTIGPLGGGSWVGISLGLLSATIYSFYILAATRVARDVDALSSATVIATAAAVVFCGLSALRGIALPDSVPGWLALLAISLISTVAAILAFMAGLARVGPTDAATLSTLEPVGTAVLAVTLLGETLAPLQILGGAIIVSAALIVACANAPGRLAAAASMQRAGLMDERVCHQ